MSIRPAIASSDPMNWSMCGGRCWGRVESVGLVDALDDGFIRGAAVVVGDDC